MRIPVRGPGGCFTERVTDTSIRVTRKVGAAAAVVFDLLANPDRHHEIDASGMVGDDEDASPITKVGQVFRMNMSSGSGAGEKYQVDNHVTQFQPNRRIAWEVGLVDGERLGWTWCYDLEPQGHDKSEVALTYDWSAASPGAREEHAPPVFGPDQLAASLDLLDAALRKSQTGRSASAPGRAASARRRDPAPSVRRRTG